MAASATAKPRHPPLRRQKSEAEILSYGGAGDSNEHITMDTTATKISHHIQHLTFVDNKHEQHHDFHDHSLGEKFHDSVKVNVNCNSSDSVGADKSNNANDTKSLNGSKDQAAVSSSSTSPNKPPLARRESLSTLEESHLTKIGAFDSEVEKARKARRKSFEKITRKRSGGAGEERSGGSRRDKGGKVIPKIPDG